MGEGKWVPPPPPRRRLSAWLSVWLGPTLWVLLLLGSAGMAVYPYLPPVRAERERVVAIGRTELDQIAPPLGDDTGGTYTTIDLWRGPYVWRIYSTGLSCQEIHDYHAETLAKD